MVQHGFIKKKTYYAMCKSNGNVDGRACMSKTSLWGVCVIVTGGFSECTHEKMTVKTSETRHPENTQ